MGEKADAAYRFRLERQAKILSAFGGEERSLPSPPYHLRDVSMIYLLCRFDADAARRIVHPDLELCDPCLGAIILFSAQGAWGLGPYSACVYGLQIRGHDSPDGYPANFVHCGFVTGRAVQAYNTHFNQRMRPGSVELWRDGEFYRAEAGDGDRPALRVRARHTDRVGPELTGLNVYVGEITGQPTMFSVGYNARYRDLEDVEIDVTDDAPESIRALKPREVVWPLRVDGMAMTYSPPRSISEPTPMVPQDALRASVFELLSVMGRPAAIVTRSGRVLFANELAQDWIEGENRRLLASPTWARRSAEQLDTEPGGGTRPQPIPVDLADGRRIFVQLLPMHAGLSEEPSDDMSKSIAARRTMLTGTPTLKQIGDQLGLSPATVSRALNGFPEVNAATRHRVEAAAKQLNYRPNQIARKLSTGRSNIVALVVQRPKALTHDTTFFGVVGAISEALAKRGYDLILHVGGGGDELEPYRNLLSAGTVDGFIINAPRPGDPRIELLEDHDMPFVVHGRSHTDASYPCYDLDNTEVSRLATDLLLDLGHRRIALLNGPVGLAYAHDRLAGFRGALARRQVEIPGAFVSHGPLSESSGYAAALTALGGRHGPAPTAFLCASTLTARGVYRALAEKQLSIPADVSVIAHDDDVPDVIASAFSPPLSVTWSPLTNACEPLAELLVANINGGDRGDLRTIVSPELIARASVGPARDQQPWLPQSA